MPPKNPLVPDYVVGDTRLADNPIIDSTPMDYLSRGIHSLVGGAGRAVGGAMKGMAENPKPLIAGTLAAGGTAMLMSNPATAAPIIAAMVSLGLPLTEAGLASLVSYTAYQQTRNQQMEQQGMSWKERAPEAMTNALSFGLPNSIPGNMLGNAIGTGVTQGRLSTPEEFAGAALTPMTMKYVGKALGDLANQAPPLNRTGAIKLGGPTIGQTAPNWLDQENTRFDPAHAAMEQNTANVQKRTLLRELYPSLRVSERNKLLSRSQGVPAIQRMASEGRFNPTTRPELPGGPNDIVFTRTAAPYDTEAWRAAENLPARSLAGAETAHPYEYTPRLLDLNREFTNPDTPATRMSRTFGGPGIGPLNDRPVPAPWSHLTKNKVREVVIPEDPITKAMNDGAAELNRDYPEWKEGRNTLLSQADAIIDHLLKTKKITRENADALYRHWAQQAPKL